MRSDRLTSPGQRRHRLSQRPSHAEATYPIEDYIVVPHDAKGRSVSLSITAPPDFRRTASVVRQTASLPFQTEGDVFRWCLFIGLAELMRRVGDKEARSSWALLQNEVEHAANQAAYAKYGELLESISKDIRTVAERDPAKALAMAERVWQRLDRLDDPTWRKRYREMAHRHMDVLKREVRRQALRNRKNDDEDDD